MTEVITTLPQSSATGLTQPTVQAINRPSSYTGNDPRWFIGSRGITTDEVVLIGAVHVSQGSWMPILQVNRFIL
jgi:hypothetical protein